jgi:hypothetical protein
MRLCLPARRTNLGSTTAISTRVRAQIASTVSFALRVPATRVQTLSLQEMFVLCQQHGFEVDITVERPANLQDGEIGFVTELNVAA